MKKIIAYFILGLFILIMVWYKTFWLATVLLIIGLFLLIILKYRLYYCLKRKKVVYYSLVFIIIVLGSIALRLFGFEIYSIPSRSMEDTILSGDVVLAGKLAYGPRMPESPGSIPWFNLFYYLCYRSKVNPDSIMWPYKRLKGFSAINYGDIVTFNLTNKERTVMIKRCVGLPGDTLKIINDNLYINDRLQSLPETAKLKYRIIATDCRKNRSLLNTMPKAFPRNKDFPWTLNNYGPICIPRKGLTIELNESAYVLYKDILQLVEHVNLTKQDKDFYIDGEKSTAYTFRFDYYWMMGDNRYNSLDSRIWGFVTEPGIIGKARVVIFSKGDFGVRWNRIFKWI